jgi:hypothetical protein
MSSKKQKEKKKKEREKTVRTKILKQRANLRAERKLKKQEDLMDRLSEPILKPIVNDLEAIEEKEQKAVNIREQLEKNLKILEALEQEYDQEQQRRVELNQKLESEGHKSIREKLDALHQKALEVTGKTEEFEEIKNSFEEK